MLRAHILYSGTVQGVGFRYTVRRFATELGLAGWVRNLRTNQVEVLVEGEEKKINQLISEIDDHFQGYIKDKNIARTKAQGKFSHFEIESTA